MNPVGEIGHAEWLESVDLRDIFKVLGNDAKIVGGAIRDTLRKIDKEITDIDIATPLLPSEVLRRLKMIKNKERFIIKDIGIKHGTINVIAEGISYDITTLRKDEQTDGRHAVVSFTTSYEEDAKRRDFTFNSLYADLDGKIYDPFGGIYDLSHGIVKFIGNPEKRINEDYLRILRFFRFFAYYGYGRIDPYAYTSCKKNALKLTNLSKERIRDELFKILMSNAPEDVFLLMKNALVLDFTIGKNESVGALRQMVWLEGRGLMCDEVRPNLLRRLSSLITGDGKKEAEILMLSNRQNEEFMRIHSANLSKSLNEEDIRNLMCVHDYEVVISMILVAWARDREIDLSTRVNTRWREIFDIAVNQKIPNFPISGKDLIDEGFVPDESMGENLLKLKSHWIKSDFSLSKEELIKILKSEK